MKRLRQVIKIHEHCIKIYDISNGEKKRNGNHQSLQSKAQLSVRFILCLTVKGSDLFLLVLSKTSRTQTSPRNLQGLEQKSKGAQTGWNIVTSHTWGMAIRPQGNNRNFWTFQMRHAWTDTLQVMEWDTASFAHYQKEGLCKGGFLFFFSSSEHFILKKVTSECGSSELIWKLQRQNIRVVQEMT